MTSKLRRTPTERLAALRRRVLARVRRQATLHRRFLPDYLELVGFCLVTYAVYALQHIAGIARGIDDARRDSGIEARILISAVRNFGVEQALRVAKYAAEHPHPYVVGFSMAGDEAGFPAGDFADAFAIAAGAGLGCTIHAGEWAGAQSVRAALELPRARGARLVG